MRRAFKRLVCAMVGHVPIRQITGLEFRSASFSGPQFDITGWRTKCSRCGRKLEGGE